MTSAVKYLKEMYLPTMPEDPLPMVINVKFKGDKSGKFYSKTYLSPFLILFIAF